MTQSVGGTENQLKQKIASMEQEISLLRGQQRDVRFLAKRLNTEIQIRLNRRAKLYAPQQSLTYRPDPIIDDMLASDKDVSAETLRQIHQRDAGNIKVTNKVASNYFRVLFWRLSSSLYGVIIKIARKAGRV